MTIHKKALQAFREKMHPNDNTIPEKLLSEGILAAFQFMYTDRKVSGIAIDQNTGELFSVMTDGRCAKYSPDKSKGLEVSEDAEETWSWKPMPPIPGTVSDGGRIELENEEMRCPAEYFHRLLDKYKTALNNLSNVTDISKELALPLQQLHEIFIELRPKNDPDIGEPIV